jgi:cell division protein FtsB
MIGDLLFQIAALRAENATLRASNAESEERLRDLLDAVGEPVSADNAMKDNSHAAEHRN